MTETKKDLGESKKNQNQKTRPAALVAADGAWVGDLNDDCWLERYGMTAHVEKMDTNHWWFNVTRKWPDDRPGYNDLFNIADQGTYIPLTTGKMARRAAECCMELLAVRSATEAGPLGGEREIKCDDTRETKGGRALLERGG